jgi:hypothetical protein
MNGTDLYTVGQLLGYRKLDSVFGEVMPESDARDLRIVTIASPDSGNAQLATRKC